MKKRLILIGGIVVLVVLVITGLYLFSKPGVPDVPDYEELSEVQLNSIMAKTKRLQEEWVTDLLTGIKKAQPVQRIQARNIKNDDDFYVIALIDKTGNRTCLHFFEYDENVYMTVNHKEVYTGVDFISNVINGWQPTGWGWGIQISLRVNEMADSVPAEEVVKCTLETDYDIRSWLFNYVAACIAQGTSKEEAVESGAEYILNQYKLCQYAIENGYEMPDGFYQRLVEAAVDNAKTREDYVEVNAQYEAAGTNFEEYVSGWSSYLWKITDTVDYMKYCIRTQFREGNYTINDISYDNADDYCNAYINDVVLEKLDKINVEKFEEELKTAKQYVSDLEITESVEMDLRAADIAEEFLTRFYTTDDQARYTTLMSSDITELNKLEEAVEVYYKELASLVTEKVLEKLQANRVPYVQDVLDTETNVLCDAPEVELEVIEGEEGSYEFTVTRTAEDIRTGKVACTKTDTGYLVDYFHERH